MVLKFTTQEKDAFLQQVEAQIRELNFSVVQKDFNRPWGGFLVIDEKQAPQFAETFFPHLKFADIQTGKLSPKVLIVQPNKRLSWQYHHRRAELWKVAAGRVGVVTSDTDAEGALQKLEAGEAIRLNQGERHRLVGLEDWGVVAEIWQHIDSQHPSDEEDIVRLQDDFGR